MKAKVFDVNGLTCKLLDITVGAESSEYIAKIETSDGRRATIKLLSDINESIEKMKTFIV